VIPILDIQHATVYRGDTCVFPDLSLTITPGCSTVILGPNGAGKSTLLKLLSRDIYPAIRQNTVLRLFGKDSWDVWELRTRIGMVSYDLQHQYPETTPVLHVVVSGLYSSIGLPPFHDITQGDQEQAYPILDQLGLLEFANRPFGTLSTGEQRRSLLGRALIHHPEVLILDEPTNGMDLHACFEYLALIRRLIQTGTTIVLVTHHLHEIPPEIDRVVLLESGSVVADGRKDTTLTQEILCRLFNTRLELLTQNGYYQAVPADSVLPS
jgi:iron complex transport system ATP-binding protein